MEMEMKTGSSDKQQENDDWRSKRNFSVCISASILLGIYASIIFYNKTNGGDDPIYVRHFTPFVIGILAMAWGVAFALLSLVINGGMEKDKEDKVAHAVAHDEKYKRIRNFVYSTAVACELVSMACFLFVIFDPK